MAVDSPNALSRHLRHKAGLAEPNATDGQLLGRFVNERDEDAFAELVRRLGPVVWAVCQRITGNADDTDDAFQATFLVLARKARGLTKLPALGGWMYQTARRSALKARAMTVRRRTKEAAAARPEGAELVPEQTDALAVIEQELGRLPKRYRESLILCGLCGRPRKDVAAHLGVPEGTLASRLATARALLAERLRKRGVAVPVVAIAAWESSASGGIPASLVHITIKTATGAVPAVVERIATGVTRAMFLSQFRTGVFFVAVVALAGAAGVVATAGGGADPSVPVSDVPVAPAAANRADDKPAEIKVKDLREKVEAVKKDLQGTWELRKQSIDDKEHEPPLGYLHTFGNHTVRIQYTMDNGKNFDGESYYTVNPTTNPPELTVYGQNMLLMCVYELDGDTLKIAHYGISELERPKSFALKDRRVSDMPLIVREFKRKAPEKPKPPEAEKAPAKDAKPAGRAAWENEFRKVYGLADGEVMKRIAPPFPDCRLDYFKNTPGYEQTAAAPPRHRPNFLAFRVDAKGNPERPWGLQLQEVDVRGVLMMAVRIPMMEVEGDDGTLATLVGGDFVFRGPSSVEERVAALNHILRDECKQPIKLTLREVEREVAVARGTLKVAPPAGWDKSNIVAFAKEIGKGDTWVRVNTLNGFFDDLGKFLGRRIVNEAKCGKDERISYLLSVRQTPPQLRLQPGVLGFDPKVTYDPAIDTEDHDPKLVLPNIEKQTGLTFTTEKRKVRVLFVEKEKP